MSEQSKPDHAEAVAKMRARLATKRQQFLDAITTLADADADATSELAFELFRLLGMITYWQSLPDPSPGALARVNQALDGFGVSVLKIYKGGKPS